MGRHSRKRGAAGAAAGEEAPPRPQGDTAGPVQKGTPPHGMPRVGTPPHGTPRPGPGTWQHARGQGPRTPAHGSPQTAGHTPPGGSPAFPQARGGHPEHREPGGGWGAAATGTGPVAGPVRHASRPGPRQEYLDAFDDTADDVFAAGAPGRTRGIPQQRLARRPGARPSPAGVPPHDEPPADDGPGPGPGKGGKGRTFTGVAAAAVTTVLAVVVAGQVVGGERGERQAAKVDSGRGAQQGDASRAGAGPSSPPSPSRAPAYGEKLSEVYPLDRELTGPGSFRTVGGQEKGTDGAQVVRYRVDVEKELPLDEELFVEAVHRTLNDDRSWAHDGERSFERVGSAGEAEFVITLASPGTTGDWCARSGLDTTVRNVSCDSAATDRIMINAYRWAQGSRTFGDERIREYREMLINHEVGHRLGRGHLLCREGGALAPVMMQQTKTLTTDGRTCRPNAWPHPG